jgi:hypothetical protein
MLNRFLALALIFSVVGFIGCAKPTAERVTADPELVSAVIDSILARPELRETLITKMATHDEAMKAMVGYASENAETLDKLTDMFIADPNCKQALMTKLSEDEGMVAMMQEKMGKRMARK